ncbi:hypothetical protein HJFPF1_05246 [Paramyrothecium foliicola]|nr:hypothetical protein HJFPF1_05246 [Paramyrothecium foliicola]
MDGTYGNPLGRSQSPMTPATPSTPAGQYQVNIRRNKTKKWVEAKAQSYDGGGWGDDDDDDESPDEQEPVPPVPQAAPATSPRLPSESRGPYAPPTAFAPSDAAQASQSGRQDWPSTGPSGFGPSGPPIPSNQPLNAPASFQHDPTVPSQDGAYLERSDTPGSHQLQQRSTFDRNEGNNGQGTQGYSLQDTGKPLPANPPFGSSNEPASVYARDINRAESSSSPQLPSVLRTSGFGADMFGTSVDFTKAPDAPQQQHIASSLETGKPLPPGPRDPTPPPVTEADNQPTTAPTSGGSTTDWAGPSRPSLPGGWVTETASNPDANTKEEKQVEEETDNKNIATGHMDESRPVADEITSSDGRAHDQQDIHSLPATRFQDSPSAAPLSVSTAPPTDTPADLAPARQSHDSTSSRSDTADIPPTQPLQPRKSDFSPAEYGIQPILRQATHSTVTSSPVKESDVLRDEIMRSLSPAKEDFAENKPPSPARQDTLESNYSVGGYDGYWADGRGPQSASNVQNIGVQEPPSFEGTPAPSAVPEPAKDPHVTPLNTQNEARATSPEPASASRQRFSWEVSKPPGEEEHDTSSNVPLGVKPAEPTVQSPISDKSESTAKEAQGVALPTSPEVSLPGSPPVSLGPTSPPATMLDATIAAKDRAGVHEPPSPVSAMSVQQASSDRNSIPGEPAATVTSPTPPQAANAAPGSPTAPTGAHAPQPQIMAFRDIMGMPTATERIEKYDETRGIFAKMESGLEDWMTNLKAQHPEHADQTSSFYGAGNQAQGSAHSVGAQVGTQPSQQQPYYQQYLNASSPAVNNAPAAGRSRFGNLPMPSQGATSTFGTSSNQIGTKSKEFMQTAGKMGKGLFNKGKSKLRGTGDKEPKKAGPGPGAATAQATKLKNERRTSWGLSLGGRARTDIHIPGPQAQAQAQAQAQTQAQAQSPSQSRQRNVSASATTTTQTRSDTPPTPYPLQAWQRATGAATWSHRPSHDFQGGHSPALRNHSIDTSSDMPPAAAGMGDYPREPTRMGAWQPVAIGRPSMDQVSNESDRPSGLDNRAYSPEPAYDRAPPRPPFAAIPEDSGIALPPSGSGSNTPKRTSFVGLPPIRRNSTLSSFDFLGGDNSELQSFLKLDDDQVSDEEPDVKGSLADKALPPQPTPPSVHGDIESEERRASVLSHGENPVSTQRAAPAPTTSSEHDSPAKIEAVGDQEERKPQAQAQVFHEERHNEPNQRSVSPPQAPNEHWQQTTAQPPAPVQEARSPPNPIHQMLPAGSWKLEESYLVEPLNTVSRNRAGSGVGSPRLQSSTDGFEKETGATSASASNTDEFPPVMAPGRLRGADVPPSAAQRYPDLFPPRSHDGAVRGPGQQSKAVAQQDYHQYMITQSRGGRPNGSSSHYPDNDMGREETMQTERAPGGFRNTGQNAPATTHDGRPVTPDLPPGLRPESPDFRRDDVSESSVAFDGRKKKRSSFLPGVRNANSTEVSLPLSRETSHNRVQTPESFVRSETAESHSERKRSLFSSAAGALTGKTGKSPLKFVQSGTSRLAQTQTNQSNEHRDNEASSSKSRLAGFKMASLANKFNRATQGHARKHSGSQNAPGGGSFTAVHETKPGTQVSTTTTHVHPDSPTSDMFPPHPAVGDTAPARHRRQASASAGGQIAEVITYRPVSKPQAKDEPTPRKVSGGSLSPTHLPGSAGAQYPGAPPHSPPQQPLPSIPAAAAPGSVRGASLEDRRPSNQFENPRASPRAPDFSAAQKSPPGGTFPRSSTDKPSTTRQAKHAHQRQSSGQWNRPDGPISPPLPPGRDQNREPGVGDAGRSRAMAASPEPPLKPDNAAQRGAKGRVPGNEHIALVQHSPKPSLDLAGPASQQQNPQLRQESPGRPVDDTHGAGRGAQAGAQGSLWKGLRSRMSEQMSHAAPRPPSKTGTASSKLLGAIKRAPTDQVFTSTQPLGQGPTQTQNQNQNQNQSQGQSESQGRSQSQSQSQSQPVSQWRPTQTNSRQSPPPNQTQFAPMMNGPNPQQPGQQGFAPGRHGPQQAMPRQQQRHNEPQYDQVPIPQGYHAVRGEGRIAPSPYNVGQQVPPPHQYGQQQHQAVQQGYQQQPQWQQAGHQGRNQHPSLPGQNAAAFQHGHSEAVDRRSSAIHGAGHAAQQVQPPAANSSMRMGKAGVAQDAARTSPVGGIPGHQQQRQQQIQMNKSPSLSGESSLDRHPSQVSQTSTQAGASNQMVNGHGPKASNNPQLGIDVQKAQQDKEVDLYDATPKAVNAPVGGNGVITAANVELEDTEEARKRTIRLESQEDKILADPEEEAPQMSATSYPGQMWNPYGMEFVDWRDD